MSPRLTRFRLERGPDYVRLLVDGQPVTNWCSLGQARAAATHLGGWRGSQLWTDDADGSEWVCERHGGPATTELARAWSAAGRDEDERPYFVPTNWRIR